MIYELITLTAAAGNNKDITAALARNVNSCPGELVAAWATEVGKLNDLLLMRRFDETAGGKPTEFRTGEKHWLSDALPLAQDLQIEQFRMMPYLPDPEPASVAGPIHELRSYHYRPGMLDELLQTWKDPLLARVQVSPAPLVMYSITSRALRFIHLWVYQSYEDRLRTRAAEVAKGTWPPPGGKARWLSQENAILTPLAFSPLA